MSIRARKPSASLRERLKEIDRFFAGRSAVHATMRRLVERLAGANIPYAIYGGMAVNAHGHRQTTDAVDVLLTVNGVAEFRRLFSALYEATPFRQGRRLIDRANDVPVDLVVTGHCPGPRAPGAIAYPDPIGAASVIDEICYVNLVWLIQLKLATRRSRDLGDVAALIRVRQRDESFLAQLPASVHQDFIECLEEKQREDDYIAREG
jgi:hypothetical protein